MCVVRVCLQITNHAIGIDNDACGQRQLPTIVPVEVRKYDAETFIDFPQVIRKRKDKPQFSCILIARIA